MVFCCVLYSIISIFSYIQDEFFFSKKAHGLALTHRTFVGFLALMWPHKAQLHLQAQAQAQAH